MKKILLIMILGVLSLSARYISSSEATNYIGSIKTVCGKVASTYFSRQSNGAPTFLNLDRPYPNHIFTAVIFEDYRDQFGGSPENDYRHENICVTGEISEYRGVAQIILMESSQLKFK